MENQSHVMLILRVHAKRQNRGHRRVLIRTVSFHWRPLAVPGSRVPTRWGLGQSPCKRVGSSSFSRQRESHLAGADSPRVVGRVRTRACPRTACLTPSLLLFPFFFEMVVKATQMKSAFKHFQNQFLFYPSSQTLLFWPALPHGGPLPGQNSRSPGMIWMRLNGRRAGLSLPRFPEYHTLGKSVLYLVGSTSIKSDHTYSVRGLNDL